LCVVKKATKRGGDGKSGSVVRRFVSSTTKLVSRSNLQRRFVSLDRTQVATTKFAILIAGERMICKFGKRVGNHRVPVKTIVRTQSSVRSRS
jgi:hypothetical protein